MSRVRQARLAAALAAAAALVVAVPQTAAADEALPRPDDFTLAEAAGTVLVGLTVRPPEPGEAALLVHLEPLGGADETAELPVDLVVDGESVAVERCGPGCRRGHATLAGGESVAVTVGGADGGTATFTLPDLPAADARWLLARATARMNALETYRVAETLGPADPLLRSSYVFDAPDRMRFEVDTGQVTIRIGERTYTRRGPDEAWRTRTGPRLEVPSHIWDFPDPVAVRVIDTERVDGVATTVVAFFLEVRDRPIWYRLWVDDDHLVRAAHMRARGHFMDHRYHGFDEPVAITPPYGPVGRAAVALLGDPPHPWWEAAAAAVRWIVQAGSLAAAGGVAFLVFVHDRRPDELAPLARLTAGVGLLAAAGTIAGLPLQAASDASAVLDPAELGDVLASRSGVAALLRGGALIVLVVALPRLWGVTAGRVATAAGLLALGSFPLTGHSATAEPALLAAAANLAHLAVAASWLGGLVLLAWVLRHRRRADDAPAAAALVARFSTLALAGVGVLGLAGAALAWTLLPDLAALPGSVYGRTLLAKLALVAAVVAVAAYNRLWLLPAVHRANAAGLGRLQRTVAVEAAGLLAALAVTALLVNVPLPRPAPAEPPAASAPVPTDGATTTGDSADRPLRSPLPS